MVGWEMVGWDKAKACPIALLKSSSPLYLRERGIFELLKLMTLEIEYGGFDYPMIMVG